MGFSAGRIQTSVSGILKIFTLFLLLSFAQSAIIGEIIDKYTMTESALLSGEEMREGYL